MRFSAPAVKWQNMNQNHPHCSVDIVKNRLEKTAKYLISIILMKQLIQIFQLNLGNIKRNCNSLYF